MTILSLNEGQLVEFAKLIELTGTQLLEGLHQSKRGGQGLEFHSTLPYSEGEDARFIDWRRFASSDKYFVRYYEREEKTSWSILIDHSKSMTYGNKSKWARDFAGTLLFLAKVWGDRFQLFPLENMPLEECFQALLQQKAGWAADASLPAWAPMRGDRCVVISDFFWDASLLEKMKMEYQSIASQLVLVQVLDPREQSFDFRYPQEFRDLESSDRLILDPKAIRRRYQQALQELKTNLPKGLLHPSFYMSVLSEGEDMQKQLFHFFENVT